MYANRSEMARTPSEAPNSRCRSAEGIYESKEKPEFDLESPTGTGPFAYICPYLRTFALKPSASVRYTFPKSCASRKASAPGAVSAEAHVNHFVLAISAEIRRRPR